MNTTVYFSYAMIALLTIMALVCFISSGANEWLPGNRRYIMGAVLLIYASVRFFRLRRFIKLNSHD